ncbi:MAG: hypothetical protein AAGE59_30170 [Cyanobacteria bacterium P01_F01_bin.86]
MKDQNFVPIKNFLQTLLSYHSEGKTGTFYFISETNHAGAINLKNGRITSIIYRTKRNEAALEGLRVLERVSYRFDDFFRFTKRQIKLTDLEILNKLGMSLNKAEYTSPPLQIEDANSHSKNEDNFSYFTDRIVKNIIEALDEIIGLKEADALIKTFEDDLSIASFSQLSKLIDRISKSLKPEYQKRFSDLISQRFILRNKIVLDAVQEAFQEAIGPISSLIYQEILGRFKSIDRFSELSEFISQIIKEIDSTEYEEQFRSSLQRKLGHKLPMNYLY